MTKIMVRIEKTLIIYTEYRSNLNLNY